MVGASPRQGLLKVRTGIEGFDEITGGGLPHGRTSLVTGGPGAGKTIFGLQTLVTGARAGESGIFVAFEEQSASLIANAATFDWDLEGHKKRLSFFDAQLPAGTVVAGDFDLQGMLAALSQQVAATGATRIVFDSVDVLLSLLPSPERARLEARRLHEWLSAQGLTAIVTAKADPTTLATLEPFGFLQFMLDCAVALKHEVHDGTSQRSLRVLKYRGSSFSENESPLVISRTGLEVASPVAPALNPKFVTKERLSTGVASLDPMLQGGYHRISSILVTGAPGTAKSTLGGSFAVSACQRGEPTLFVSFDSERHEIVRNLASVNVQLAPHVKSGLLTMHSARASASSAEVHLLRICALAREHRIRCLVIDPISAMGTVGNDLTGSDVVERLVDWCKSREITLLCTSLLSSASPDSEASPMQVSTIADTWLHLSYVVNAGERNRALTIIKSRGTAHSNQVRELVLTDKGVTLTDVYTAEGQVLMGTLRWQKERAERLAQQLEQDDELRRQAFAELERDQLGARLAALAKEVQLKDAELASLRRTGGERLAARDSRNVRMLELRGAAPDAEPVPGRSRKAATS